jgi:hypothetical protein
MTIHQPTQNSYFDGKVYNGIDPVVDFAISFKKTGYFITKSWSVNMGYLFNCKKS